MRTSLLRAFIITVCLAVFLVALSVSAMAADPETDVETVEHLLSAEEEIARVSAKAEERKRLEPGRKITFEDILANPNDVNLNFAFAQQQMTEGDFLGASSTLERILMKHPDLVKVRLLYAMVLYRLDNLKEAERELNLLLKEKMPENLREDLEFQLKRIRFRRRVTHFFIRQNVGYEYDDNRNAGPSSNRQLTEEEPVEISGAAKKRGDTSLLVATNLLAVHDLGFQAGHEVYGSFTYFLQDQTSVDNLDLAAFQGEAGGTWKSERWLNLSPRFTMSHVFLARETFFRAQGLGLRASRAITPRLSTFFDFHIARQDYLNITLNSTASERTGPQMDLSWQTDYALSSTMQINGNIGYTKKSAKEGFFGYDGLNLGASHTWLLGGGQFLIDSVQSTFDFYDEVDENIAGRHRRDKTLRYRAIYGAPLSFFKLEKILPKMLEDVTFTFTYEHYRALSSITNYTYRNNKYLIMLTKTWSF